MISKTKPKFPREEVQWLLVVAKNEDKTTIPEKYLWITNLSQIEARDELLFRFQRLVASLVEVCLKGKPGWSDYTKTFLKMLGGNPTNLGQRAYQLKLELIEVLGSRYDSQELFRLGQLAVLEAIERCRTNLASTIVACFRDLIDELIKKDHTIYLPDLPEHIAAPEWESGVTFKVDIERMMGSMSEEERDIVERILEGETVRGIPKKLKARLARFLTA